MTEHDVMTICYARFGEEMTDIVALAKGKLTAFKSSVLKCKVFFRNKRADTTELLVVLICGETTQF